MMLEQALSQIPVIFLMKNLDKIWKNVIQWIMQSA